MIKKKLVLKREIKEAIIDELIALLGIIALILWWMIIFTFFGV